MALFARRNLDNFQLFAAFGGASQQIGEELVDEGAPRAVYLDRMSRSERGAVCKMTARGGAGW